jgi:hypothetical protein
VFITGFALLVATWMAFFASWLVQHAD